MPSARFALWRSYLDPPVLHPADGRPVFPVDQVAILLDEFPDVVPVGHGQRDLAVGTIPVSTWGRKGTSVERKMAAKE